MPPFWLETGHIGPAPTHVEKITQGCDYRERSLAAALEPVPHTLSLGPVLSSFFLLALSSFGHLLFLV